MEWNNMDKEQKIDYLSNEQVEWILSKHELPSLLEQYFRSGFKGFENMTNKELDEEWNGTRVE
tara:strand:- start:148 stop:336 length:189 start_codon:yes stop_codon:yes gene_type:complete